MDAEGWPEREGRNYWRWCGTAQKQQWSATGHHPQEQQTLHIRDLRYGRALGWDTATGVWEHRDWLVPQPEGEDEVSSEKRGQWVRLRWEGYASSMRYFYTSRSINKRCRKSSQRGKPESCFAPKRGRAKGPAGLWGRWRKWAITKASQPQPCSPEKGCSDCTSFTPEQQREMVTRTGA